MTLIEEKTFTESSGSIVEVGLKFSIGSLLWAENFYGKVAKITRHTVKGVKSWITIPIYRGFSKGSPLDTTLGNNQPFSHRHARGDSCYDTQIPSPVKGQLIKY